MPEPAADEPQPPRRSKRAEKMRKREEKKRKKEEKAKEAEKRRKKEEADAAAAQKAAEAAEEAARREAERAAAAMAPPPGKGRAKGRAKAVPPSPVPSPSRLRAQTGTTFAFGWEGEGFVKHGRGGRGQIEESDQGYITTYYRAFSRKHKHLHEQFAIGDSVQLYAAEQNADIQLAELQDMFEDCLGTMWVRLKWYYLPNEVPEAALGSAGGGAARVNEVFTSNHLDDVEVSCVQAKVVVRQLTREQVDAGDAPGETGRITWRSYDVYKKRVRPIAEGGSDDEDAGDSDDDVFGSSDESDHEHDRDMDWNYAEAQSRAGLGAQRRGRGAQQPTGMHHFKLPSSGVPSMEASSPMATGMITSPGSSPLVDMETLSVFAKAREVLRPGALPASMPCRERERHEVADFLRQSLNHGAGSQGQSLGRGLYVSGVPGTGKTATVYEVVRSLREEWERNAKPQFRFVEINGMSLPDPSYAFSVLHEELTGQYKSPQKAADSLDKWFSEYSEQRACTVLLLDEVDLLVTRKQNVLYQLLNWPTYPWARLIVVAIANTMDLPERLLPRLGSRLGLQRVSFKPYDQNDIRKIVAARLGALDAFEPDAIELCARKVASVSGDVRRALQICRRASEVAEERCNRESSANSGGEAADLMSPVGGAAAAAAGDNYVVMKDVLKAVKDMSNSSNVENIQKLPLHARLCLCILAHQARSTTPAHRSLPAAHVSNSPLAGGAHGRGHASVLSAGVEAPRYLPEAEGKQRPSRVLLCAVG